MQFLYRLSIKKRLLISSLIFFCALFAGSALAWNFFHSLTAIATDNRNIEFANSHIQKAIRSLNEYVISEGTDAPLKTSQQAAEEFAETCRLLARTTHLATLATQIEKRILPQWAELEVLLTDFYRLEDVALENDSAMIALGRVLTKSDLLMGELEGIRSTSLALLEAEKRHALILLGGTLAGFLLVLLSSQFAIYRSVLKPIKKLSSFARGIAQGDLDQRIEYAAQDELSILANTFNQMAESLSTTLVSKSSCG